MYTANGQAVMRGGALVPYSNPYDFSTAFADDLNAAATAGQAPNPRTTQEFNLKQAAADKYNAAKARLAGSPKIQGAVAKAQGAYGSVSKYLGPAGVVLSAGVEAKDRLDRGEDGQRAATGALANAGGAFAGGVKGAAVGAMFGGVPGAVVGGLIGGIAGGAAAGYATDRVTDAVRGNDGKGTDTVLKDMAGQIESARAGGNFARAAQLTQEALQFQSKRMGQNQPGYAEARGMGIAESDVETFRGLQSQQAMGKYLSEQTFAQSLNQNSRQFDQQFGQQTRMFDDQQRRGQIERLRNQVRDTQNKATQTQQDMILDGSKAINDYGRSFASGLAQSYQGGGIR